MHEFTEEERSEFQPAGDKGEPSLGIISSTYSLTTWPLMPTSAAFSNDHCLRPPKSPISPASMFTEDTNTSGAIAVLAACLVALDLILPESGYGLWGHPFPFHMERASSDGTSGRRELGGLCLQHQQQLGATDAKLHQHQFSLVWVSQCLCLLILLS